MTSIRKAVRTLRKAGFKKVRQAGSHQTWAKGNTTITICVHAAGRDLPRYKARDIQEALKRAA
jgi:predicted RNA binding protein YcfA (HicA-like mRNA interferase family)